jgi:chromosomal replication initiation ATPase DnaA
VYVTVESFLNELTQAIQAGSEAGLRERYEELDILLLDDVQFFTGQKEAQEMLLRLLDGMNKSGGQVVLASDRPPSDIDGLDGRLLTRFSGGLIVDIAAPEYETKVAILRKKGEERGQTFEAGVAEALAKHPFKSVRELAGALNKVLAIQELEERQVEADEIVALAGLQESQPDQAPVAGEPLLDEFGSFIESEDVPWKRLLRETAEIFEKDGYSGTRLRRILESGTPPSDPQQIADQFRRDVAQLREVEKTLNQAGNPWPEAAVGVLKDPERVGEAASLLASALERVKPFTRLGDGPPLTALTAHYDAVVIKAAAKLITDERPEYNPLYLWSKNREGPLALVAATARSFREAQKASNIAMVSAAEFAEDYIRALEGGVAGAWRERWWDVDLLIVYDAELISATESTKDEFFHLFEASKRRGTKIMIAADRPPSGISDIDERLRSRFEMGLVVEAPGRGLPAGAGELNLEAAPSEYIEDDDLWGSFMQPAVAASAVPPVPESKADAGPAPSLDAPTSAPAQEAVQEAEPASVTPAVEVAASAWKPSRENVVWDWHSVGDRIVEMAE